MIRESEDLSVVRTTLACLGGDSKGILHGGVQMNRRKIILLSISIGLIVSFWVSNSSAASEVLIIVTPTIEKKTPGSIASKSPTSFSDIIIPSPESTGLVGTAEALRRASSVDLSDYGGATPSPVTLRGSSYRQTLVTLDGIPLNPLTGDMVDLSQYVLPDIAQIEIIKGSNSAAFGNSAMGGTINLVTENPSPEEEYDLYASQGTYGYGLYHGHASTTYGGVGLLANITHSFADSDFRYEKDDGSWTKRTNNSTENTTGLFKSVFDCLGWKSSLMGNFIDQSNGSPGAEPGYLTPNDWVDVSQDTLLMETSKSLSENQSITFRGWLLTNETRNERPSWGEGYDNRTRLTSKNIFSAYTIRNNEVNLTSTAEYLSEKMKSDDYGDHSRGTGSVSMAASADLQNIFIDLSGRYDNCADFDSQWSYHAGAIWKVADHVQIKANAGTGYLIPDMGKLYSPSSVYSSFIPNPDLKPERSFGWDIGPGVSMNTWGLGVNYYFTAYRDLIKADYPSANTFTYINVNKAQSSGVEANAWFAPVTALKFSTNYILSKNTFESGPYEGNELGQRPAQVMNLQADYMLELASRDATISLAYQFREGSYEDDANTEKTHSRYLLNAGALLEVSKSATISFKIDNLLDDQSPEYVYKSAWGTTWYPVQGRTYRFAAKISF